MNFEDDFKKLKEKAASLPDLEKLVKQLASQGGGFSDDETQRATLPYGGPKPRTTKPWKMKLRHHRSGGVH